MALEHWPGASVPAFAAMASFDEAEPDAPKNLPG